MFVPIYDYNPLRHIRFQYVTLALVLVNAAVSVWQTAVLPQHAVAGFGLTPARLLMSIPVSNMVALPYDPASAPAWLTLVSYMFFHGDIWHLATNMLFLWVFGDNVEDALGHLRFLVFYICCGIAAGAAHAFMQPLSTAPLIGASGAVAGVIAAYVLLYPRVQVWVLVLRFIPLRITAAFAIGAWILSQIVMVILPQSVEMVVVAWWAHIGGLAAGAALMLVLRRPGAKLTV